MTAQCTEPGCSGTDADYYLHRPSAECEPCLAPQDHHAYAPEVGRWTVEPGRLLVFDGVPVCYLSGRTDATGYRYIPAELDTLTHSIAIALNAGRVDGSKVTR